MINLILSLLTGLIGGLVVAALPRLKEKTRNLIVLFFCLAGTFFNWRVAFSVFSGKTIKLAGNLAGFSWSLNPDPLAAVFGLLVSSLWLFTAIYSFGYMRAKDNLTSYYSFFLIAFSITIGVAYSANLVIFYLFYELLTFVTYPLVIHQRTPEALKAGSKYMLYSLCGAAAILMAIVITYNKVGSLDFGSQAILAGYDEAGLNLLLALFVFGFGVKAAIMPLHGWLPNAMLAPTPVSALLHAVAVVYSGVYGILRVVYSIFGIELIKNLSFSKFMPWLIGFTILAGVLLALRQDVLKRRLAYQTVSHLSYILLGAFSFTSLGLTGAIMHMISYSSLKVSLFFSAGIISEQTGETKISKLTGIGWLLPKTMLAFSLATAGMIGMLPLNTFWGKYYLMQGSIESGKWPLAIVLIISGIVNAICFVPIIVKSFQGKRTKSNLETGSKIALMLGPTLVLAFFSLLVGLCPAIIWPAVKAVVDSFF